MRKNKILEKLLAIILIFTLTFANFAFVSKTYAASLADVFFGTEADKNVSFEAYFGAEDEGFTSVISDVNEDLSINAVLKVKNKGYLRDAKIEVVETEEGNGLNFNLKAIEELPYEIQGIEDNAIYLRQINASEDEVLVNIPVEFKNESYMNENDLSKDLLVKLTGTYIGEDGDELEVDRDLTLRLSWKDSREVNVETSVNKFIDFGSGVILQTSIKVDNTTDRKTLPVKESDLTINAPVIDGKYPSNVDVVANSTMATNGKSVDQVIFDQNNWTYDSELNTLSIKVDNQKELVQINTFEDEFLQEIDREIIQEERFYNGTGVDEYLVTYTYLDVEIPEEEIEVNSMINAKMITFSGVESEEYNVTVENSDDYTYSLNGKIGDIVSLNIENETREVSKANTYLNYENSDRYETEMKAQTVVNVSYKDIINNIFVNDVNNYYLDKEGTKIDSNDTYYKSVSISKENFTNLLGENGEIKVLNNDEVIASINNETEADEFGNITLSFGARYSRLSFEISKPVSEGNIVLTTVKAMANSSLSRDAFINAASIGTETALVADYNYVEENIQIETANSEVLLNDTKTNATISIDRDSLSTLSVNEGVELRIALNNATESSDVYGHSVFEFDLPEYVESFEITNANLLYAEGLEIVSLETIDRTVRIVLDGKQEGINSGVLTNGTNIVLNTNIKINLYTPAKSEVINLRYQNDKATAYENEGMSELEVRYSAPTGLVAVNSTFNYDSVGSVLTSVRQGSQEDLIDIYSEAKVATMEVIVMNNNGNTVSNVSILGRIPFEGVKDIATGEELGTTVDTRLVSGVVSDERNNAEVVVYYSENSEATKDLDNAENGWVLNPESLENMKSYLIVPVESDYEMAEAEILRFTYEYEIPENLAHNQEILGTFLAYYTNNSEVAVTEEVAEPDVIGLSTGAGPEVTIAATYDRAVVKEYEQVKMSIVGSNVGKQEAQNVVIKAELPEYTKFSSIDIDEKYNVSVEGRTIYISADSVEVNEDILATVYFDIDEIPSMDDLTDDEDEVVNVSEDFEIEPVVTIDAKDLGTTIKAQSQRIKIKKAEIKVEQIGLDSENEGTVFAINSELYFILSVENLKDEVMNNVVVTFPVPEEVDVVSADIMGYSDADPLFLSKVGSGTYDESTRMITFNIDKLNNYANKQLEIKLKIARIPDGLNKVVLSTTAQAQADGTDVYSSNTILSPIGKPELVIEQTTTNENTYIKEGDTIKYIFSVKNEGSVVANSVRVTDVIPEGIRINNISYVSEGVLCKQKVASNKEAVISATINPGSELVVTVSAVAAGLNGVQEKTVTNYGKVSAESVDEVTTNSITHIVEAVEDRSVNRDETVSTDVGVNAQTGSNVTKTYKISGIAWLDENNNGMRDGQEKLLSGISAKLVNSDNGYILRTTTTDTNGNYTFSGVENGTYLVIFDYDTVKYTVTTYQQENVGSSVNSDAITTRIEQDGKGRNAAVTDKIVISSGSISNIDIGLIYAQTFDLSLTKAISKVTTQTSEGKPITKTFDNVQMAKTEIRARYLAGATVYVQYAITVKNNGDIGGYAKKIVDYIPNGMTFNSSLEANEGWYTGTDGNLYNDKLADIEIAPGETKTINLVLTKAMNEENTGIVNNLAEIYEDYNIYGISDKNSTPANKAQGENDLGSADMVIEVSTGGALIYTSIIIITLLLMGIFGFVTYTSLEMKKKRKEGGV